MSDKPKVRKPRPVSAFQLFLDHEVALLKVQYPGIRVSEISNTAIEKWMSMEDKSVWEEKAAIAKEQYEKDLKLYYEANGREEQTLNDAFDEDEDDTSNTVKSEEEWEADLQFTNRMMNY